MNTPNAETLSAEELNALASRLDKDAPIPGTTGWLTAGWRDKCIAADALRELAALRSADDDGMRRSHERMIYDFPKLAEFFSKHALGSKVAPSCFGCGKAWETWDGTTRHLELPDIYLCASCAKSVLAERVGAQGVTNWRLDNLRIAISTVVDYVSSCVDSSDDAAQMKYRAKVALGYAKEAQSLLVDWLRDQPPAARPLAGINATEGAVAWRYIDGKFISPWYNGACPWDESQGVHVQVEHAYAAPVSPPPAQPVVSHPLTTNSVVDSEAAFREPQTPAQPAVPQVSEAVRAGTDYLGRLTPQFNVTFAIPCPKCAYVFNATVGGTIPRDEGGNASARGNV